MKTLILGAGYAGLATATKLKPVSGLEVLLVEKNPFHTYETRLHEAAAHHTHVTLPIVPLLKNTGVHFEQAAIDSVNLDDKEVALKDGRTLTYDTLVVALGSVTNFYRIPGLAENAAELKTIDDANGIYNFINEVYAPGYTGNRDIVVGGAGLSGVELITELAKRVEALSHARGLPKINLYLVEAAQIILPTVDPELRARAKKVLEDYGIHILLGQKIVQATAEGVTVEGTDGQRKEIPSGKTIWTGGVAARDIVKGSKLEKGPGGRIVVDDTLRAKNYPEVFVIGDMGLALDQNGKPVGPTAQNAGQQGRLTAENLMRMAKGESLERYEPYSQGEFVSLGGLMAVGWMQLPGQKKLAMTGGAAHIMKRASEWRWRMSVGKPL